MMSQEQKIQQQIVFGNSFMDYGKGLEKHAFFKIHSFSLSQDLVQDTFSKAWSYVVKGGKIEVMKTFLYHILGSLIIDEYRKHKTTSLDALLEKGFEPSADESESLFNNLDGKTAILLIDQLPVKYRGIIKMRFVRLLSLKEISLITGQTKNTVAVQIHRGLVKLRLLNNLKSETRTRIKTPWPHLVNIVNDKLINNIN